jgi:hypothetical protein
VKDYVAREMYLVGALGTSPQEASNLYASAE